MMQGVLYQRALRQVGAIRSALVGVAIAEPPAAACCCCVLHSAPAGRRGLSTSAPGRAVEQPKQQPEAKPQPSNPYTGLQGPDTAAKAPGAAAGTVPPIPANGEDIDPLQDSSIGLVQRFKKTFKQYGKVMIPVHLLTSSMWFGTFYYAAMKGVNVVPFLELIGLPESIVGLLRDSQSGYALTAYAMYKIATPARYTMTLGGTSVSVQYLRKHGYLSTPPPVKEYIQDKMEETREKLSEKMEETKELLSEKMVETKELLSETKERFGETKDKFSERIQETKELLSETKERFGETKDKFSEKIQETKELLSETKERFGETKDKFSEKIQETKDKVSFRKTDKTKRD
ncbi:uncharacterized protein C18orf19 homolog B [Aplochiton taeniatus]